MTKQASQDSLKRAHMFFPVHFCPASTPLLLGAGREVVAIKTAAKAQAP